MIKKTLFVVLSILSINAFSQKGSVEGHIYDKKTNEPIMFANIIIQGTNIGASSDEKGYFVIKEVPVGFVRIEASSIGYNKGQTPVLQVFNNKSTNQNIYLDQSSTSLMEVSIVNDMFEKKSRISSIHTKANCGRY
jgi:hypothetical protein